MSYIDVEDYEGDLATICFCSASVHGIFGCQNLGRKVSVLGSLLDFDIFLQGTY